MAPVAALAVASLIVVRVVNLDVLWGSLTRPKLIPVSGQVLYQGQPLLNGQIVTHPVNGRGLPALGWTDDEGKFTLKTDIQGNYVDGATVGEHRVTVTAYQLIAAPAAPPLRTPEQYASPGSSPLRIIVGPNAADNQFQFVLEGEAPRREGGGQRGGGQKGGGQGGGKKGKKGKAPPSEQPERPPEAPDEAAHEPQSGDAASSGKAPESQADPAADSPSQEQP